MSQSIQRPRESTDEQATRFVIERNALQARVAEIAAAWDVWGEAQHEIRRMVRTAEWSGDLPDGGQREQLKQQFSAQIFEAYARARVQCAIVRAVDGVDQVAEYDRHWQETWGAATATAAGTAYAERFAAALERQRAARAAAAAQSAALEAAGVTCDVAAPATTAAPTLPPTSSPALWSRLRRLFAPT